MMFQIFGRRGGKSIVDRRSECGTWRAGELAVCINDTWFDQFGRRSDGPKVGDVLRVTGVVEAAVNDKLLTLLHFDGRSPEEAWSAAGFRKPVVDEAGADEAVAARIKRARREPTPMPAPVHESVDA